MTNRTYPEAMAEYRRAKAALKEEWKRISRLRGDAYTDGLVAYQAEKARVKQLYEQVVSARRSRPSSTPVEPSAASVARAIPGLARELTAAFVDEQLDLTGRGEVPAPGWAGMPECIVADRMRADGAKDADVRLLLTFTAAMDRARDADKLWFAAERLWRDASWTMDPENVVGRTLTELADLLRSHRVSQRHGPDAAAWRMIAESLTGPGAAQAVGRAVYDGHGDAAELLQRLQSRSSGETEMFPLLRGPKVGPMWVRMLAHPGRAEVSGLDDLPVAVDVQVRKVSEYLGVADTGGLELELVRGPIQAAWSEDVHRSGAVGPAPLNGTPAALDPALWFWGKWGCTRCERIGHRKPIGTPCQSCRFPDRGYAGDRTPSTLRAS